MIKAILISLSALIALVATVVIAAGPQNFVAPLSGVNEVPATITTGTGVAKFKVNKAGDAIDYRLIVANIEDVTQAHIHCAPAGSNGPVVVFLFAFVPGGVTENGILAQGTITDADIVNDACGADLAALAASMESGDTYVNVHTVAIPSGEIRGQIK